MTYTIIDRKTQRVTHLQLPLVEARVLDNIIFIPTDECAECSIGQLFDPNTGLFRDFIMTRDEFEAEHARRFSESDIVILRHLEGSRTLSADTLTLWQDYRTELRTRYHTYEAHPNYLWPTPP